MQYLVWVNAPQYTTVDRYLRNVGVGVQESFRLFGEFQPLRMSMADFQQAIPTVLQHEGGYCNDPHDSGGETNFGICKRSYPQLDIASLTPGDAQAIYHRDFWIPLQLDQVNSQAVATKVLDTAVLVGKSRAVKFLQRAVLNTGGGVVEVDGQIGPKTIAAANQSSAVLLLENYRQQLATYYGELVEAVPTNQKFLNGWLKRANS